MSDAAERQIEMIPIDRITVVNSRARGKAKFKQIVSNISNLGLKKPVTVATRTSKNGEPAYDLVCGQGRLEAYKALGQSEVPAFVINATKEELMLMSLAENLARRIYSSADLMREIGALKARGHNYAAIAKTVDLHVQYVKGIIRLLNKGEERLLRAVEAGHIPITIAVTIASSNDAEVQQALRDAYEQSALRGNQLLKARKLIEERRVLGRRLNTAPRRKSSVDSNDLLKAYQQEMSRQRVLVKKAKITETRFLFVISALKQLLRDDSFVTLLRAEVLDEVPQYLADQIALGEETTCTDK